MTLDDHTVCRARIDDALVGGSAAALEDAFVREHMRGCGACQEYLDASARAIASLGAFSFEVDGLLEAKVCEALEVRARELKTRPLEGRRLAWCFAVALLLTVIGSLLDLAFGDVVASVLHVRAMAVRQDLLTFWIVPSLMTLLLFPLLPVLAGRKERIL